MFFHHVVAYEVQLSSMMEYILKILWCTVNLILFPSFTNLTLLTWTMFKLCNYRYVSLFSPRFFSIFLEFHKKNLFWNQEISQINENKVESVFSSCCSISSSTELHDGIPVENSLMYCELDFISIVYKVNIPDLIN